MQRPFFLLFVLLLLPGAFFYGVLSVKADQQEPEIDLELGEEINETCAGCHGEFAQGGKNGLYPRLAGLPAEYLQKQIQLFKSSERLNIPMKPYANDRELPYEDIYAVTAYIENIQLKSSMPEFADNLSAYEKLLIARQVINIPRIEGDIKVGEKIYNKDCKICHGKEGKGKKNTDTPRLSGQYSQYLLKQIKAYKAKKRHHDYDIEDELFDHYTQKQIQDLLAYLSVTDDH